MTWRNKLRQLLGWPAAMGGLTTAGLTGNGAVGDESLVVPGDTGEPPGVILPNTLNANAEDLYAQHRSHRSHSSHGSHRSSSGNRRAAPKPTPEPSSPPVATQTERDQTAQPLPKPTAADLSLMVVRAQAALMQRGYYDGDIDGLLGEQTRAALRTFQKEQSIKQTGRLDIETLTRLGIPIQ